MKLPCTCTQPLTQALHMTHGASAKHAAITHATVHVTSIVCSTVFKINMPYAQATCATTCATNTQHPPTTMHDAANDQRSSIKAQYVQQQQQQHQHHQQHAQRAHHTHTLASATEQQQALCIGQETHSTTPHHTHSPFTPRPHAMTGAHSCCRTLSILTHQRTLCPR